MADTPPDTRPSDPGSSDSVTISLELVIAGEKVGFQVTVPSGPATWEDLLPFMRTLVQVGSDISQEYFAGQGRTISCRAGCGICCRQRVPIAEFEAHRLRRLVDNMPEPRRSVIRERFRSAEDRIREAGSEVEFRGDPSLTVEEMGRRAANYFRLMIPCPFLEDESCSIYEERPLKCREYLVTSPAEFCAAPDENPITPLPMPLSVYLTTLFLDDAPDDSRLHWVPLTQLLSWTDEHSPEPPRRTGPELLQEFLSRLSRPAT